MAYAAWSETESKLHNVASAVTARFRSLGATDSSGQPTSGDRWPLIVKGKSYANK